MGRSTAKALWRHLFADVCHGNDPNLVLANMSFLAYGVALLLIILVSLMGSMGMGAQRWIDLGFMKLQPSELAKLGIVMALAAYYDMLPAQKVSRPVWVALPFF